MMQLTVGKTIDAPSTGWRDSLRTWRLWLDVWAERRALAALGPAQLADIGVSEAAATRESERPFWDVPARRHFSLG